MLITTMTTYTNEDDARAMMRRLNNTRIDRMDLWVMVDGPGEGEFAVMSQREAIEGGFLYCWQA